MSHHMLDGAAERELLASLPFDEQCGEDASTVRYLYSTKMKKCVARLLLRLSVHCDAPFPR